MKNQSKDLLKDLTPEEKEKIVSRIIYLRHNILNMTQQQFADVINISQTYLSLIENGKKEIKIDTLLQISYILKVNLDWLIYGFGDDENIFQTNAYTKDSITQGLKDEAIEKLASAYSLKDNDIKLIKKFLSLSDKERTHVVESIISISKLL